MRIVIGNIVALVASIAMIYSGCLLQKKKILFAQTVQTGLSVVSNIILGGITGAIVNILSSIRNILCYKGKLNNVAKAILITLVTILSLNFNNLGIIGLLPLVSTVTYILLMNIKNIKMFKCLVIYTMILWCCYDLCIKSYTSACFDFINIVANFVSIIQISKNKKEGVER